jgi:hypothetical protein
MLEPSINQGRKLEIYALHLWHALCPIPSGKYKCLWFCSRSGNQIYRCEVIKWCILLYLLKTRSLLDLENIVEGCWNECKINTKHIYASWILNMLSQMPSQALADFQQVTRLRPWNPLQRCTTVYTKCQYAASALQQATDQRSKHILPEFPLQVGVSQNGLYPLQGTF